MNIVLYGLKCSGKTTVGKLLAKQVGWGFVDVDRVIEALYQQYIGSPLTISCREIFIKEGEDVFRTWEKLAVARIASQDRQVIAAGGGSLLQDANYQMLKEYPPINGQLVFLDAKYETLEARMKDGKWPAYLAKGDSEFTQVFEQRMAKYSPMADILICTDDLTPEEVVAQICRQLSEPLAEIENGE